MTPEGIAQAKDQAIKLQSRKRPSSSTSPLTTLLREFAAKGEVERKYSVHSAIEDKLAGLGVLASSEELEAFKKAFTDAEGVAVFDALIKFLGSARKKYVLQNVAPLSRKSKLMPGERASSQVKKGYDLYQKSVNAGEKLDWEEIARECLPNPGKANSKATWQQRKGNFRKAIFAHKRRLKKG
jgi:hypothetical protein